MKDHRVFAETFENQSLKFTEILNYVLGEYKALHQSHFNIKPEVIAEMFTEFAWERKYLLDHVPEGGLMSLSHIPPEIRNIYWMFVSAKLPLDYTFIMNNDNHVHWYAMCCMQPVELFLDWEMVQRFGNQIYWNELKNRVMGKNIPTKTNEVK